MRPFISLVTFALAASLAHAQPQCLSTVFASNNGGASGWVVLVDVNVLNPNGISIQSIEINANDVVGGTNFDCEIYTTPGTFVGAETNPGAWILVATGSATTQVRDTPTPVDVTDFTLPPGSHGFAVRLIGVGPAYTNGTGGNQFYSNADLEITAGSSVTGVFTGSIFDPRVWNGTICYQEASECFLLLGLSSWNFVLGGDPLLVEPMLVIPMSLSNLPTVDVPNNNNLIGLSVYAQSLLYNPLVYPSDPMKVSDALDFEIGVSTTAYGQSTGIIQWPLGAPVVQPGGQIRIGFAIP